MQNKKTRAVYDQVVSNSAEKVERVLRGKTIEQLEQGEELMRERLKMERERMKLLERNLMILKGVLREKRREEEEDG